MWHAGVFTIVANDLKSVNAAQKRQIDWLAQALPCGSKANMASNARHIR
jgi:hypothetical protein